MIDLEKISGIGKYSMVVKSGALSSTKPSTNPKSSGDVIRWESGKDCPEGTTFSVPSGIYVSSDLGNSQFVDNLVAARQPDFTTVYHATNDKGFSFSRSEDGSSRHRPDFITVYYNVNDKVFLVENKNTIEIRCDRKLGEVLGEKYESVMRSRYFGKGGIEIVKRAKQLKESEVEDLIRLSYNLTKEM